MLLDWRASGVDLGGLDWMDRIDVLCGLDRFLLEAPGAPVAIPKLGSIGLSINVVHK